jgi:hypothetical protein
MTQQRIFPSPLVPGVLSLVAGVWLAAAHAQPLYTPFPLVHPAPQERAGFGLAVAGVGDVNGDTVPDLLVGASGQTVNGNIQQGQAYVLSGADGSLLHTLTTPTPQEGALFGDAVAGVGDVDGDGVPDLLVGAPFQTVDGNGGQGQAFVWSGAAGTLLHTLDDPTPQVLARFGRAVAGVGDVDGDGVPDLLVGAPGQTVDGNIQQGQAFVWSGAAGTLLHTLDDPTPQAVAGFGLAVARVGDVDGDGVPDLLVGAPGQTVDGNIQQGQAFVWSGAAGTLLHTLDDPTPQADAVFGAAVAGGEDVDGDGVPDLLVGAPGQTVDGNIQQGQAFVWSGAAGTVLHTLDDPTPQTGALFGLAVAGGEDVNGDGVPDLLVGAPGQTVDGNGFQGQAVLFISAGDGCNDSDGDGICDEVDNCPEIANPDQSDLDGDGLGDACDADLDGDTVPNASDNCPFDANADQLDTDGDGAGDVCDNDVDGDGVLDAQDACVPSPVGAVVNAEGCAISELCPCEHASGGEWKNHGAYVSCVAQASNDFLAAGLITEAQKDATVSAAGESACGQKQ